MKILWRRRKNRYKAKGEKGKFVNGKKKEITEGADMTNMIVIVMKKWRRD